MSGTRVSRRASVGLSIFTIASAAALAVTVTAAVVRGASGRKAILRSYELTADLLALDVSRFVGELGMSLETIAAYQPIPELVLQPPHNRGSGEAAQVDREVGALQPLVERFEPVLNAFVLDAEGSLIALYPRDMLKRTPHYNFAFQSWYPALMVSGKTTVGNLDATLLAREGSVEAMAWASPPGRRSQV